MLWDLFCRVIDNFGDIGVCWRLAADLGARGEAVRLWVDDASALAWMAPGGAPNVRCVEWHTDSELPEPGDVVVEAFGCDPPPAFVARMARRAPPPLWINLEYLSAEAFVRRNHGLRSPQLAGPGRGLDKWFYYPGFESGTGGLLREPGLIDAQRGFDGRAWLRARGIVPHPGERLLSLFCYDGAPLPALLHALADAPALLLLTPGAAARAWRAAGAQARVAVPPSLRCIELPWLAQPDYDRLLWACELNFVRGEDSFVRAQWAGAPFVWHIYPQHDAAHAAKLQAFLDLMLADADPSAADPLRRLWLRWNGLQPGPLALPEPGPWRALARGWRDRLLAQPDLGTQLLGFVAEKS
ncbi:MAG TPA: elongation factor P maturation arginine rhamnosyltransferase EarP [Rubrivivax sp.]|nr:elongation factor P maturation arginine rhamnosyltransferase EarP [Rubrivivax sp.]